MRVVVAAAVARVAATDRISLAFQALWPGQGAPLQTATGVAASAAVKGHALAKPNYQFEKRQRELEKKRKQEEKRQRDLVARSLPEAATEPGSTALPAAPENDDGSPPG